MAEKLQTIKEIHQIVSHKFEELYPSHEASSLATIIIEEFTGKGRARQMAEGDEPVTQRLAEHIAAAADRIACGEPLQYVLGYTIFCDHRIALTPAVLIPRPETEELTAMIIKENKGFKGIAIDYCTGSGCIALSLACAFPSAEIHATDVSTEALKMAEKNAVSNNAGVIFHHVDLIGMKSTEYIQADLIVSNPPYVRESEKRFMRKNVLDHEPEIALFVPDEEPLVFYNKLCEAAVVSLKKEGRIYLEINQELSRETAGLFQRHPFKKVTIIKDLSGRDRFIKAEKQ